MSTINYPKLNQKRKVLEQELKEKDHALWLKDQKESDASSIPSPPLSSRESLEDFLSRGGKIDIVPPRTKDLDFDDRLRSYASLNKARKDEGELRLLDILESLSVEFLYQHPMRPYVVDFYLPQYNLIIEVDGPYHKYQKRKDSKRDSYFRKRGIQTYRTESGATSKEEVLKVLSMSGKPLYDQNSQSWRRRVGEKSQRRP